MKKLYTFLLFPVFCLMAFSGLSQTFTGTPITVVSQQSDTKRDVGANSSLHVINGNPAISYHAKTAGVYYIRATDASGADWPSEPVLVANATSSNPLQLSNMVVADGNPLLSYYISSYPNPGVRFKRADDESGEAWPTLITPSSSIRPSEISLAIVNGFPAISYFDPLGYDLVFVRATDATGTNWGTPVILDNGGSGDARGRYSSLTVVDGHPAVTYHNTQTGRLMYIRANDASGSSWPEPQVIDSDGNNGGFTSLQIINGRPAVAYQNKTFGNLKYIRANDATGSTWGTPLTLDSGDDTGYHTSLAVINGVPAISYLTKKSTTVELKFIRGNNADGSGEWAQPQVLDVVTATVSIAGFENNRTSLTEVNGTPAISFYDFQNNDLKYIRSTTPIFVQSGPEIIHVKVGGTGDGSSWTNAMGDLQAAIDAPGVREVWVAKGTYYSPANSFKMKNNVAVYGGFPDDNNDAGMDERDWETNQTILHGNEQRTVVSNEFEEDNKLLASAILDGFTITRGYNVYASGIVNFNASPTLRNLILEENRSEGEGGAMYNLKGSPTITNVRFINNTSATSGGAIYNEESSPTLIDVLIQGNAAIAGRGAGIVNRESSPTIINSLIINNHIGGEAGAVYNELSSSPTFINVTISGNTSQDLFVVSDNSSSPLFLNSIVWGAGPGLVHSGPTHKDSRNNNIGDLASPGFVEPGVDFRLSATSPAINAGDNSLFPGLTASRRDMGGDPRVLEFDNGGVIDLGALESQCIIKPGEGISMTKYVYIWEAVYSSGCYLLGVVTPEANSHIPFSGNITVTAWAEDDIISFNNARFVRRHYDLTMEDYVGQEGAAIITLFFTKEDFQHYNERYGTPDSELPVEPGDPTDNLRIVQFHGNSTSETGLPDTYDESYTVVPTSVTWNARIKLWEVKFLITEFSGFFVTGQSDAVLPVKLKHFTAEKRENTALLSWTTTGEINASHFEVQQSMDGKSFKAVGSVPARGNKAPEHYSFQEELRSPASESIRYYRLKMVDLDGTYTHSEIRSVFIGSTENVKVGAFLYPNPAGKGKVRMEIDGKHPLTGVRVFNSLGREVRVPLTSQDGSYYLEVTNLEKGLYYVLLPEGGPAMKLVVE